MLEDFQNEVIRPVIKSKNDFIMLFFSNYKNTKKLFFKNKEDKKNKIEQLIKNDIYFKNIMLGSKISNFNELQLNFFLENKPELSKRIVNIIAKRIFDNYIEA
jgi:hypothetical protein